MLNRSFGLAGETESLCILFRLKNISPDVVDQGSLIASVPHVNFEEIAGAPDVRAHQVDTDPAPAARFISISIHRIGMIKIHSAFAVKG